MILADEGLNGFIVRELRNFGFVVDWIAEIYSFVADGENRKSVNTSKSSYNH